MSSKPEFILHIWQKLETALSLDPQCIAAIYLLQLSIPGRFAIEYCSNPDEAPSGQLPYLTHGLHSVSGFLAIQKFVEKLEGSHDLDTSLHGVEHAKSIAQISHAESELGDLVAHYLFSLKLNWYGHTHKLLVSEFPLPQRYYVPERIRESYKPRLIAANLWNIPEIEEEKAFTGFQRLTGRKRKDKEQKAKIKKMHEREKVLEHAKTILDIYSNSLGSKKFFYAHSDRPTTLDVIVAAHIQLLHLPLQDSIFHELLTDRYPTLLAHATHIHSLAFPSHDSFPPIAQSPSASSSFSLSSLSSLLPKSLLWSKKKVTPHAPTAEERKFALIRWGFFGAAAVTMGAYMQYAGFFALVAKIYVQTLEVLERQQAALAEGDDDDEEGDEEEGEDGEFTEADVEEEVGEAGEDDVLDDA